MGQLNLRVLIQAVDRATGPIRRIARALRIELPSAARIGGLALTKLTGLAVKAGVALAGLAAFSWGFITAGAVKTGAKFEQFAAVLETIEGSSEKAQAAMAWVQDFAKTTPYELDQVMEAFVSLRAYGIDPTDGSLRTLGDAASAMNKPLMQAVEMLADAQTGEFERLKEFGVRGSAAGKQVALTYQSAGREVTVTSKKAANDIRTNLLSIFDSRFKGAMDRQAGTMNGLWSNLKDMLTSFQRDIADAGLFDFVKVELASLLAMVNTAAANGDLAKWAKEISGGLVEMLKALKELVVGVDWVALVKSVVDITTGFINFMNAIGGFETLITTVVAGAIGWLTTALMGVGAAIAGILGVAAAPIVATIAIIGLLATAAWFVYRNWDQIVSGLKDMWSGFVDFLGGVWKGIQSVFKLGVDLVWKGLPPWFRAILTGAGFVLKVATNAINNVRTGGDGGGGQGGGRPRPAPPGGAQGVNGQVGVDVRVHQDGRPATVTARSNSPQVPVVTTAQYRGANGR